MARVVVSLALVAAGCARPAPVVSRVVAIPRTTPAPATTQPPGASLPPREGVRTVVRLAEAVDTPRPDPHAGQLDVEQLILTTFGAAGPRAVAIARCESRNFANEVVYGPKTGSAGERGVFQAHPGHWDGRWNGVPRERVHGFTFDDMWEPAKAIAWAHAHSHAGRDWTAWTCA